MKKKKKTVQEEKVEKIMEEITPELEIPKKVEPEFITFEVKILNSCADYIENHLKAFQLGMRHAEMRYKKEGKLWQ